MERKCSGPLGFHYEIFAEGLENKFSIQKPYLHIEC